MNTSLKWVIATELGSDSSIGKFIEAVQHSGSEIIPIGMQDVLTPSFVPQLSKDQNIIFYGPVNWITRMEKLGYSPGVLGTPDKFSYENLCDNIPHEFIFNNPQDTTVSNAQGIVDKLSTSEEDQWFFKPCLDNKTIAGSVKNSSDIIKFCQLVNQGIIPDTDVDTKWILSVPYGIESEYRLFVIDGNIITGSQYTPVHDSRVPFSVINFAHKIIAHWCPEDMFVLDIAVSNGNFFVMEIQNFHSAGFYESDINLLVDTINKKYQG